MSYDARKKEVLEALDKTDSEPAAKADMRNALEAYFQERARRLDYIVDLLEPSTEFRHRDWIDKAKDAAALARESFSSVRHGKLWLAKISHEEHTFFYNIMVCQVPVRRDRMVQQTRDLAKAEKEFEEKWDKIKNSDNRVDDQLKKVAEQYGEILNSAARVAATVEKETKEKMADFVKLVLSGGLAAVNWGVVEALLKGAAGALGLKLSEVKARKYEIHALFSREEGIYATFKEAREVVEEFLEETSYPLIKASWSDGEAAADKLASRMPTDAQRYDASVFGRSCKEMLQKVFSVAEKAYKSFAKKHEYLFFGPLGSAYYAELGEDDFWKERSSRWKDSKHDIDNLLRDRTLAASESQILEVSLSGLESEDRRAIYYKLERHCRDLLEAWNKFKEFSNDPYWALESRETFRSVLEAMR